MRKRLDRVMAGGVAAANSRPLIMVALVLAISAVLLLTACGSTDKGSASSAAASETYTNTPASIDNQEGVFSKKLVPLNYEPGAEVESLYYDFVTEDNEAGYVVQPEGEEPMKVPVNGSVIYLVSDPEECRIEKVVFDYTPEGGETEHVEQYRIYSAVYGGEITVTGGGAGTEAEAPVEEAAQEPTDPGSPEPIELQQAA